MPSAQSLSLLDFSFSDFELSDMETTLATVRMFVDLDLVQNFQMKYTVRTWALGRSPGRLQAEGLGYHRTKTGQTTGGQAAGEGGAATVAVWRPVWGRSGPSEMAPPFDGIIFHRSQVRAR